ncbi:hypothetical protein IVA96_15660 [Bradyrhizobium sp. 159]|uniref:hypothetical protein n=1 Tax=Bradyrhizobium sp. 159 TaxID=2782632 RepID=UPI001FFA114A|nr:hypothetical protein [Bradyrhizobium sp. 159]MCK1618055.1 hypothetical protein [Bradyrhizobium sp. 159]
MPQATNTLTRLTSTIDTLFADHQVALAEKRRVYALAERATDDKVDAAEAACDVAHGAVENIADAILMAPAMSVADLAIKAQLLLARGADPADLFHYRPEDLTRFVQEVRGLAGL